MNDQGSHDDRIFLRGLSAECVIGFVDWERLTPQTLLIDLEFPCDCAHAARGDSVIQPANSPPNASGASHGRSGRGNAR